VAVTILGSPPDGIRKEVQQRPADNALGFSRAIGEGKETKLAGGR